MGGHRGVADRLVHRGGPGPLVGAALARVAPQWGQMVACGSSLAEQAGHLLFMTAPSRAPIVEAPGWEAIDDRPPGPVRRRSQGDTWPSAARRSDGAPSSPRRSPARPRPSPRLVVTGRCRPGRHDPAGGAGSHRDVSARWGHPDPPVGLAASSTRLASAETTRASARLGAPVSPSHGHRQRGAPIGRGRRGVTEF